MGADIAPKEIFEAALHAVKKDEPVRLFLYCTPEIQQKLKTAKIQGCTFCPCEEVILMEDEPLTSLRKKKNSSLVLGIQALKKGEIEAFISCANTGSLLAASHLFLPPLPLVKRPALIAELPIKKKRLIVLDVGGSVHSTTDELIQFAFLGTSYHVAKYAKKPTLGLLNIGVESQKGTEELKSAWKKLNEMAKSQSLPFTFLGNIEPVDAFSGKVDIVVTNGFAGNIFLKTA